MNKSGNNNSSSSRNCNFNIHIVVTTMKEEKHKKKHQTKNNMRNAWEWIMGSNALAAYWMHFAYFFVVWNVLFDCDFLRLLNLWWFCKIYAKKRKEWCAMQCERKSWIYEIWAEEKQKQNTNFTMTSADPDYIHRCLTRVSFASVLFLVGVYCTLQQLNCVMPITHMQCAVRLQKCSTVNIKEDQELTL